MTTETHELTLSVTEATARGISGVINAALQEEVVLERHGKPVAVVMSYEQRVAIREECQDLLDLVLVTARQATSTGKFFTSDDLYAAFGTTREEVLAMSDDDDDAFRAQS
jgi:prevent-host-death family protein